MNTGTLTMNQGDVFLFLHDIFGYTYETIAYTVSDIAAEIAGGTQSIDTSVVNRMAHQKRKSSKLLGDNADKCADKIFAEFIADPLSRMTQEEKNCKLFHAKEWTASHGRTFLGMDSNDPCEEWLMRMLKCSLMNWNTCYDPEKRKPSRKSAAEFIERNLSRARIIIDDLEMSFADFIASRHIDIVVAHA
ncbi:MAG: hypothetical protein IJS39_16940 [Synergistaceae bacterium]|nr:hypothetical protein [Synergistaceae bacterium]